MKSQNIKNLLIIFIIVGIQVVKSYGQDRAKYNLYNLYHPVINPAAMGGFDQLNALMLFNYQMVGFDGAPINLLADVSMPIGKNNAIVGVQISHDRMGLRNRTVFGASFAYRVKLNLKHYLSFGISALGMNMNIGWQDAQDVNFNDPILAGGNRQLWSPDFKLGAYYFSDRVYAGFSVGNLFNFTALGDLSVDINNIHFHLQGGVNIPVNKWKIQPSVLMKYAHGSPMQIDVNAQFLYNDLFGFGLSYRTLNTLLVQVNVNIAKTLRVGYGFNMGLGFRNNTFYSGHEVVLIYTARKSIKNLSVRCPRF